MNSNYGTAWMLYCIDTSSAEQISSLILTSFSLEFFRHWQNADRFFARILHAVLLTPFQMGYICSPSETSQARLSLSEFISASQSSKLPPPSWSIKLSLQHSRAFLSQCPGLLHVPAADQFQSHGRVYHGDSPTSWYHFSASVIFLFAVIKATQGKKGWFQLQSEGTVNTLRMATRAWGG